MNRIDTHQLTRLLRGNGVTHFSGAELLRLGNRRARRKCKAPKYVTLPFEYRDHAIALGLYLELIRARASGMSGRDHPLGVLGGYRPGAGDSFALELERDYNKSAGGSADSAHIRCCAADVRSAIGQHKILRMATVETWRDVEQATGFGRYAWGRDHVEVLHAGGKLARQWSSPTQRRALNIREVSDRCVFQLGYVGRANVEELRGGLYRATDVDMQIVIAALQDRLK